MNISTLDYDRSLNKYVIHYGISNGYYLSYYLGLNNKQCVWANKYELLEEVELAKNESK